MRTPPDLRRALGPSAKAPQGILEQFWLWSLQTGLKNAYASIKAFSETDFTENLKTFNVPTLVIHGEDDQIDPIKDSAKKTVRLITGAGDLLSGCARWPHIHAPGSGQRRPARVPSELAGARGQDRTPDAARSCLLAHLVDLILLSLPQPA